MNLALFDFDGTITRHDTFIDFLIVTSGRFRVGWMFLWLSPWVLLYVLKLIRNDDLKQRVLTAFFRGSPIDRVRKAGEKYAKDFIPLRVKQSAMDRLQWHRLEGHRVILVSASLDVWLEPWCRSQSIELISSRLEILDGCITGRLDGANCYGPEKVLRLRQHLNLADYDQIYAYGDSRGDREMLAIANHPHYRVFD